MSVAQLPRCTICQSSQHARPSASRYEFPECGSAWITHVTSCAPVRRIASATFGRRAQLRRDVGPAAVVEEQLELVDGEHVGHARDRAG